MNFVRPQYSVVASTLSEYNTTTTTTILQTFLNLKPIFTIQYYNSTTFLKMVNTRAQAPQNNLPREDEMDDFEDNTSDLSLAEICTHPFELVSNDQNYEDSERDFDRVRTERKFNEMNRQIGELTSLVRTLIEKVSSRMATIHLEVDQRAILAL